jgi:hypothetical protein
VWNAKTFLCNRKKRAFFFEGGAAALLSGLAGNLFSITLLFEFVVLFVPLVSESYVVSKTERLFEKKKNSSFYFNIRLVLL